VQDVAHALAVDAARVVGASASVVATVSPAGLDVVERVGPELESFDGARAIALDSDDVLAIAARERRPVWHGEHTTSRATALVALPVLVRDRVAAVVAFGFPGGTVHEVDVAAVCALVCELAARALERAEWLAAEAASRDELLQILRSVPQSENAETGSAATAAVCRQVLATFGADVAFVLRLVGDAHVVVEWREPTSTLFPPGRWFATEDVPELATAVDERDLVAGPSGDEMRIVGVPIVVYGGRRRVLVVQWLHEGGDLDQESLLVLQRFADQIGLALEGTDRSRAEREARRQTQQTQRLLSVSAALAGAHTLEEVATALAREGRVQMGADRTHVLVAGGESVAVLASDPWGEDAEADAALLTLDSALPIVDALRRNEVVLVESVAELERRYPQGSIPSPGDQPSRGASASVPLTAGSAVVGGVELLFEEEYEFSSRDREFLAAFGRQGGLALERARLYAAEHSLVVRLQRELLPARLPEVPGLLCAAVYQAGSELLEVGGDWYDVVQLGPARVGITVGDVVGKGVVAAGTMGRLRSALRALALVCDDPAEVIALLDRFAETIEGAELTTLCYAELDVTSGQVRFLSAGHPPMLMVEAGGETRFVDGGRAMPLCIGVEIPRTSGAVVLEPGATLILYSDGLVERRTESLDVGFARLQDAAAASAQLPVDELAPTLVRLMTDASQTSDDVVVLAVRRPGS
jgi:serine phosphatase RsbU (regulator of sigma subunit)